MNWLDKLERKYGNLCINNLMLYIIGLTLLVYIVGFYDTTGIFISKLVLDPSKVMQGEVWRLLTYIFIPPTSSYVFIAFVLYFYYFVGTGLEDEWGSFKFNLYYLVGFLGTTLAFFITGGLGTAFYLNLSLFLAFAKVYPDVEVLLFFIIPVKIKFLAIIDWIFFVLVLLFASTPTKIAVIVALSNFFLFFGQDILGDIKLNRQVHINRRTFRKSIRDLKNKPIHKCTICGITERDNPQMEFRYCSKCDGHHEYCMDHIKNHEHISE